VKNQFLTIALVALAGTGVAQTTVSVADMSQWTNPNNGSLDIYQKSKCVAEGYSSPSNKRSTTAARENDQYAGFIASYQDQANCLHSLLAGDGITADGYGKYAEYVQIELGQALTAGKSYEVSTLYSLADNAALKLDKLDMLFSKEMVNTDNNSFITGMNNTDVDVSGVAKGTWTEVKTKYTAKGGEKFLILGANPNATSSSAIAANEMNSRQAYYLMSSVKVAEYKDPDSDKDGIVDTEDKCPTVPGVASAMGCPDSDGDGIADADDTCPNKAGLPAFKGCPDTDNDGIADNTDKCPTVAGIEANGGCPEVDEEVTKVFDRALKGIFFESGKDVIKSKSYKVLDEVVSVMKDHSEYKLDINGHTDSQGKDANNLALSKKRAAAVKKYLVDHGVSADRLQSEGFGETQPVADNGTADGRAKNRRVAFKVRF